MNYGSYRKLLISLVLVFAYFTQTVAANEKSGIDYRYFQAPNFNHWPAISADCRTSEYKYALTFYDPSHQKLISRTSLYYVYDGLVYRGKVSGLSKSEILKLVKDLKVTRPSGGRSFGGFSEIDSASAADFINSCDDLNQKFLAYTKAEGILKIAAKKAADDRRARALELERAKAKTKQIELEKLRVQEESNIRAIEEKQIAREEKAKALEANKQRQAQTQVARITERFGVSPVNAPYNDFTFAQLISLIKENGLSEYKGKFFWVSKNDTYEVSQVLGGQIFMRDGSFDSMTISISSSKEVIEGQRFKSISKSPVKLLGVENYETVLGAPKQALLFSILE